jgi:hypothetical protein
MGRVLILHLAIIFGMWAMAASDSPLAVLYVPIALKTLWDLAASNASAKAASRPKRQAGLKLADVVAKDGWRKRCRPISARANRWRAAIEDEQAAPARSGSPAGARFAYHSRRTVTNASRPCN